LNRTKMSLDDLKSLYPEYRPAKSVPIHATRKGFKHKVNPVWLPSTKQISPAKYHHSMRKMLESKKKLVTFYECPVCHTPMKKTAWCEDDRKWAALKT
jgi:hypothetical protein